MGISKKAFGKRLRTAREGLRLTQAQLGSLVGDFSQKTVSWWETGVAEPDMETLGKLAVVLTTSVGWLVAGEGKAPVFTGRRAREARDDLVRRREDLKVVKDA